MPAPMMRYLVDVGKAMVNALPWARVADANVPGDLTRDGESVT